ncbi:unnamed protein product [Gordionus sp. m RMFG-2023]
MVIDPVEKVQKTELVGKTIIKAQLGDEIKRLSIHNDDLTYDELVLMMQRVFKDNIAKDDDIRLKYSDEDGDLITLSDNAELNTALEAGSILKLSINISGKEFKLETSEVKKIRKELKTIRDRINYLLDCLELKCLDKIGDGEDSLDEKSSKHIHNNLNAMKIHSSSTNKSVFNPSVPMMNSSPALISGGNKKSDINLHSTFDPFLQQKEREEIEGKTEENDNVNFATSRAPPSGSSITNNMNSMLRPSNHPNIISNPNAPPSSTTFDQHNMSSYNGDVMNGEDHGSRNILPPSSENNPLNINQPQQAPYYPYNKTAPPQILPTIQHVRLPPHFHPPHPQNTQTSQPLPSQPPQVQTGYPHPPGPPQFKGGPTPPISSSTPFYNPQASGVRQNYPNIMNPMPNSYNPNSSFNASYNPNPNIPGPNMVSSNSNLQPGTGVVLGTNMQPFGGMGPPQAGNFQFQPPQSHHQPQSSLGINPSGSSIGAPPPNPQQQKMDFGPPPQAPTYYSQGPHPGYQQQPTF